MLEARARLPFGVLGAPCRGVGDSPGGTLKAAPSSGYTGGLVCPSRKPLFPEVRLPPLKSNSVSTRADSVLLLRGWRTPTVVFYGHYIRAE